MTLQRNRNPRTVSAIRFGVAVIWTVALTLLAIQALAEIGANFGG